MARVTGQTVRKIDSRRESRSILKPPHFPDPGRGVDQTLTKGFRQAPSLPQEMDGYPGSTDPTRHPDLVARQASPPEQGGIRPAQHGHIQDHRPLGTGEVPTQDLDPLTPAGLPSPPLQGLGHRFRFSLGKAHGKEDAQGFRRHGGQIRKGPGSGPEPGLLQGEPIPSKMDPFHGKVHAHHQAPVQHGAVVPGAFHHPS